MALARLILDKPGPAGGTAGVTLVVYAPYGTDAELSGYPNNRLKPVAQHPLLANLANVAAGGVHVIALVDLVDDDTWLVEYTAGNRKPVFTSRWKQQMDAITPLAGLIRHACDKRPGTALVLGLEGHGAGYLPEIDRRLLSAPQVTDGGKFEWHVGAERGTPMVPPDSPLRPPGSPVLPMGSPLLPMGSPLLPMGSPLLPANHLPMSTWALGEAIRRGLGNQVGRLAVIHFNNCFNMAVEVLHTVSALADYAVGFSNYNFFTAGATYAGAFAELAKAGNVGRSQQMATWLAEANGKLLRQKKHHPTVGGAVRLGRLTDVATAVDALARALIAALTSGNAANQHAVALKIRAAIRRAQQYDTHTPMKLESPDELTDLGSLATELLTFDVNPVAVKAAATQLQTALAGIKVYGDSGTPWVAPEVKWDFSRNDLAMNILCPDPDLVGLWDWRAPFYLQPDAELRKPPVQPHVIDFLKKTAWVKFIVEYHRQERFIGIRTPMIPAGLRFDPDHKVP